MRVIVAGATGAVGLVLVEQLVSSEHDVIGITRSEYGARRLRSIGAQAVVGDVLRRDTLLGAFPHARADAVIHQATAISKMPTAHRHLYETNRLRTEGTANLLDLARTVGARRFVTQSFLFGYGYRDHGTGPVTESAPFGAPESGKFERHAAALRQNEDAVLRSGDVEGVSLRYGMFYGFEANTLKLLANAERGMLFAPRRGGIISMIHLEDAASATIAALERGEKGEAYNIADHCPLTWTRYMQAIADAVGGRPPYLFPNAMLRMSPYLGTLMTQANLALDTGKAQTDLGWNPRFRDTDAGLADILLRRSVS